MRVVLTVLAYCCMIVAFVNFFAFYIDTGRLGGSAGNGYVRDGRYFVGARGGYTEVKEVEWRRSFIQGNSVYLTHLLGMFGIGYLLYTREFPPRMLRRSGPALAERVRSIEAGSAPLVVGRCGGHIGGVAFGGPILKVALYPTGVVIKPIFMRPIGVALNEVEAVRYDRVSYVQGLIIDHSSPFVQKPIYLYCREDDPLATNLRLLVGRSYRESKPREGKV
jgi:hypothetical protein